MDEIAADGVELPVVMGGQDWRVAWHPPPGSPPGTPHGAAAICLTDNALVLVSSDGENWDLPGGRPEPNESLIDTFAARDARRSLRCTHELHAAQLQSRSVCARPRTGAGPR